MTVIPKSTLGNAHKCFKIFDECYRLNYAKKEKLNLDTQDGRSNF